MHVGAIGTFFDDCIGFPSAVSGVGSGTTLRLAVTLPVGQTLRCNVPYRAVAWVGEAQTKKVFTYGVLEDANGVVCASAEGLFYVKPSDPESVALREKRDEDLKVWTPPRELLPYVLESRRNVVATTKLIEAGDAAMGVVATMRRNLMHHTDVYVAGKSRNAFFFSQDKVRFEFFSFGRKDTDGMMGIVVVQFTNLAEGPGLCSHGGCIFGVAVEAGLFHLQSLLPRRVSSSSSSSSSVAGENRQWKLLSHTTNYRKFTPLMATLMVVTEIDEVSDSLLRLRWRLMSMHDVTSAAAAAAATTHCDGMTVFVPVNSNKL